MKLWLVRHAEVVLPQGICYGAQDVAVNLAASAAAAQRLALELPVALRVRYSMLQRCEHLAITLQGMRPDLILKPDARLRELDFGAWEGQPWSGIAREAFDAWLADFAHASVGGTGECVAALMARVADAYEDWRAEGQDAVWITHAGVIRAVRLLAAGVRQVLTASAWPREAVGFGRALVLEVS